jgi:hypothetical protein
MILRRFTQLALAALGALALLLPSAARAQSFSFVPVAAPDPGPFTNILAAVAAPSDDEAWAVGNYLDAQATELTLAMRFVGTAWSVVPSASIGTQFDDLTGVAASAPGDVWAVGGSMNDNGSQTTLIERWDGSQFVIVPSPNPTGPTGNARLTAVVALASNDVWAVGEYIASGTDILPLFEHWDGSAWTIAPSSGAFGANFMWGIAAVGPSDIWAVGERDGVNAKTVAMHWNGATWTSVATPSVPGSADTKFKAVAASPSGVVFAVGSAGDEKTLAERWSGSAWVIVPTIDVATQDRFFGVSVRSASDVIVVGSSFLPSGFQKTLVEWFDGSAFHVVASPNPDNSNTPLAIAAPPCGPQWIVGGGIVPPLLETQTIQIAGPGGPVVDLGGGCGAGGTFAVQGPVSMGSKVRLKLTGADPGATLGLLNVASVGPATGCGPCALVPYQITLLLPLSAGAVTLTAKVPCAPGLLGASVELQWTVGPTAATGCPLLGQNRALSNAVQVTIGQ